MCSKKKLKFSELLLNFETFSICLTNTFFTPVSACGVMHPNLPQPTGCVGIIRAAVKTAGTTTAVTVLEKKLTAIAPGSEIPAISPGLKKKHIFFD